MTQYKKIGSALFYALASLTVTFFAKIVLTSYKFKYFQVVALGQVIATLLLLHIASFFNLIQLMPFQLKTAWEIMPLSFFNLGNLVFGLYGTMQLSLPMFTVLRRSSVLLTMYLEWYFLQRIKKPCIVQVFILMMVGGSVLAALDDLSFNATAYTFVFMNNIFTAALGIYTKLKLNSKNLTEFDLLKYNSTISLLPLVILTAGTTSLEQIVKFKYWDDPMFLTFFAGALLCGFFVSYSWMLCTNENSPLTTSVVGCLKNIITTYAGTLVGGDYVFSNLNFIGLTISTFASVAYSLNAFWPK